MKDRTEVIWCNQCSGVERELVAQFEAVRQLNPRLSKPVLHVTLSLAPGEELGRNKLIEMSEQCAGELGFEKNQWVAVHHRDTGHQHLHLVANRVGFDGRTVSDSNNYKKVAAYCRKMEMKYNLQQVLSPRRFLSQEQRQLPRLDQRKEKIRQHIKETLSVSRSYEEFERLMKEKKYEVLKARGIAFRDGKKVYVKGSELGYSLQTIQRTLEQNQVHLERHLAQQIQWQTNKPDTPRPGIARSSFQKQKASPAHAVSKGAAKVVDHLLRQERSDEPPPKELLGQRKKQNRGLHH